MCALRSVSVLQTVGVVSAKQPRLASCAAVVPALQVSVHKVTLKLICKYLLSLVFQCMLL